VFQSREANARQPASPDRAGSSVPRRIKARLAAARPAIPVAPRRSGAARARPFGPTGASASVTDSASLTPTA
jgi:hypothetical protein